MRKNVSRPLTGCCASGVLWMASDDVTDVFDEASMRAEQARDLAAAIQASEELSGSDDAGVLRSAMGVISTLLSDAMGLYGYAHELKTGLPARE